MKRVIVIVCIIAAAMAFHILDTAPVAASETDHHTLSIPINLTGSGNGVSVPIYLQRDTNSVSEHPSSITFNVVFDDAIITPSKDANGDLEFTQGPDLFSTYAKFMDVANPATGDLRIAIYTGHREMDSTALFLLGHIKFDVLGATSSTSNLTITNLSMANSDVVVVSDAIAVNGLFTVD